MRHTECNSNATISSQLMKRSHKYAIKLYWKADTKQLRAASPPHQTFPMLQEVRGYISWFVVHYTAEDFLGKLNLTLRLYSLSSLAEAITIIYAESATDTINPSHYCRRQHQVKHLFKLSSVGFKILSALGIGAKLELAVKTLFWLLRCRCVGLSVNVVTYFTAPVCDKSLSLCRCVLLLSKTTVVINNNVPSWHVDNIKDIYHASWSWFIVVHILNYSLLIKSSSAAISLIIKANSSVNV
ncbi:hypothetical protein GQX74_009035 [Glossina fuscipes]|nr:hypothetical protein GQX74_009035 [Glossina fuscipes]